MERIEDLQRSIPPHPDDVLFLDELRRLAFLAAEKFNIPLRSVAHKAMPASGVGEALCYDKEKLIRLVLRFRKGADWAAEPMNRERVVWNLGWMLPVLVKKDAGRAPQPRVYMKQLRDSVTRFLLDNWNARHVDHDEVQQPVI